MGSKVQNQGSEGHECTVVRRKKSIPGSRTTFLPHTPIQIDVIVCFWYSGTMGCQKKIGHEKSVLGGLRVDFDPKLTLRSSFRTFVSLDQGQFWSSEG